MKKQLLLTVMNVISQISILKLNFAVLSSYVDGLNNQPVLHFLDYRAEYNPKNDLLDQEFMLKGKWYQRKDLEVRAYKS